MRASDRPPQARPALVVAAAALFAGAFALAAEVESLWPLAFLAPAPLTWIALRARSARAALLVVYAAALLTWLWIQRWILQLTPPGYAFLALYLAVFPALFVLAVRIIRRSRIGAALPMTLLVPVAWVAVEFLRGDLLFHGYPWYLLGHPLIEWLPLVQSADLFGAYGTSFIAAMGGGFLVDIALARGPGAGRRVALAAGLVGAVAAANVAYGLYRLGQTAPLRPGPAFLVIQTNLPQDNKIGWTVEDQARDVPLFIEQTRQAAAAAGGPLDLIIWPETMVPGVGFEPDTLELLESRFGPANEHLYRWSRAVEALSRELAVPLLVGAPAWVGPRLVEVETEEGRGVRLEPAREYNSAYLIQGAMPYPRYDKYHLTPFGETMPYVSAWPWLEEKLLALGAPGMTFSLDRNPDLVRLDLQAPSGTVTLATPICYEDTVARVCRRMVCGPAGKAAHVLVNLSNDGWFGWDDGSRAQHARIARFRSIECRVPMVRAVNTGLSVAIDSCGRITARIGPGRYGEARHSGALRADLSLDERRSGYGRWGDAWAWGCLALTAAAVVWGGKSGASGAKRRREQETGREGT